MTNTNVLSTEVKVISKLRLDSMTGLIRDDAPEMIWDGKLCKKKVVLAHELYKILLPKSKNASRDIDVWFSKGIEGYDFIKSDSINPSTGVERINHFVKEVKRGKGIQKVNVYSGYFRVEFTKRLCMEVKTPEADAVKDYIGREADAYWQMQKRTLIALPAPASVPVSPTIEAIISEAVQKAAEAGRKDGFEQGKRSADYDWLALSDLRVDSTTFRHKNDLRADIVRTIKMIAQKKGLDYQWLWRQVYSSFGIQISACHWRHEWHKADKKLDYLMNDHVDIKYMRRLRNIVQSWE